MDLTTLKILLDLAILPVAIFAYKLMTSIESINKKLEAVVTKIDGYEKDNRSEHQMVLKELYELDKKNSVEHAQLGLGAKK